MATCSLRQKLVHRQCAGTAGHGLRYIPRHCRLRVNRTLQDDRSASPGRKTVRILSTPKFGRKTRSKNAGQKKIHPHPTSAFIETANYFPDGHSDGKMANNGNNLPISTVRPKTLIRNWTGCADSGVPDSKSGLLTAGYNHGRYRRNHAVTCCVSISALTCRYLSCRRL